MWNVANWTAVGSFDAAGQPLVNTWKMNLDMLDGVLSRPFYQGRRWTVSPYGGLRALWVRQRLELFLSPQLVVNQTHSWSLGPVVGSKGHFLFGGGFRLEAKGAASVLYTQYTANHKEHNPAAFNPEVLYGNLDYRCLRPTAELGLGLGWGAYLDGQQYYVDLSLRYDFLFLWNQNLLQVWSVAPVVIGGLMLHGLTATFRYDF